MVWEELVRGAAVALPGAMAARPIPPDATASAATEERETRSLRFTARTTFFSARPLVGASQQRVPLRQIGHRRIKTSLDVE